MKKGDIIDVRVGDDTMFGCEVIERDVAQGVLHTTPDGRCRWADPLNCTLKVTTQPKNQVFETMTKFSTRCCRTLRVWREEPTFKLGPDKEIEKVIHMNDHESPETLAAIVGALPRVAAIEILDRFGNGGLFYPDWK